MAAQQHRSSSPAASASASAPAAPPSLGALARALTAFSSHFKRSSSESMTSPRTGVAGANAGTAPDLALPTAQWELAPWNRDEFPRFGEEQVQAIWHGEGDEVREVRASVQKAVEEMELNWKLDPCLLGTRSESNRGNAAIVSLLSRLALSASSQSSTSRTAQQSPTRDVLADQDEHASAKQAGKHAAAAAATAGAHLERPPKTWERHDLLRAIERQDHETILEIRTANFDLLLDAAPVSGSGPTPSSPPPSSQHQLTPLGYAISLGPRWQGTAIVLTGALSKFVNSLPDPDEADIPDVLVAGAGASAHAARPHLKLAYDPRTMARLRKLRSNLKLAVDHSLSTDQTQLLASYVQVLFMSEGLPFILDSVASLRTSLRAVVTPRRGSTAVGEVIAPEGSDPVQEAKAMVGQFVNQGLKKRDRVAAVGDLCDNAAGDLVLMALWDLIKLPSPSSHTADTTTDPDLHAALPPYFFARDDRITQTFLARVEALSRWVESSEAGGGGGGGGGGGEGFSASASGRTSVGNGAGAGAGHAQAGAHAHTRDARARLRRNPAYRRAVEVAGALRGEGGGGGEGGGPVEGEREDARARGAAAGRVGARVRLRLESGERLALLEGMIK